MVSDKKIGKMKETQRALWAIILTAIPLFIFIIFVLDQELSKTKSELYCGSRDIEYTPVYNESSNAAVNRPIGAQCCNSTKEKILDTNTGQWNTLKHKNCIYKPIT